MKSIFVLHLIAHLPAFVLSSNSTIAPIGCRKLSTDSDWPAPGVWKAAIPGVIHTNGSDAHGPLPNYRIRVQDTCDVQAAVKFATKHNVRLTVITTGHDQLGRRDGGSGLIIDLSLMNKVEVLESFTPTKNGAASPNYTVDAPNVIVPKDGVQASVTFGPAVVGLALNYAVSPSGLFTTSGAAGKNFFIVYSIAQRTQVIAAGVAVGGGWGQSGGYRSIDCPIRTRG